MDSFREAMSFVGSGARDPGRRETVERDDRARYVGLLSRMATYAHRREGNPWRRAHEFVSQRVERPVE